MDERKYVLSVKDEDGNWVHIPALKGNGIESIVFNEDGTLTVTETDGTVTVYDGVADAITAAETATAAATSAASAATSAASTATGAAGQATSAATEANSAADAANTAADSASEAASTANTAAATATSAATNANTKASLADENATLAAEKAALADEKATAANTAAASATSAASSATSAAGSANTAAASANSAASAATTAAGSATSAATSANAAATNANEKATLAQTAATAADAAREAIQDDLAAKADKTYVDAADAAQSSRIATKAEKSALASTDREVSLLRKAIEGQLMEIEEDHAEAYSKTLPSGTIGVGVNSIGWKSRNVNQLSINTLTRSTNGIVFTFSQVNRSLNISGTSTDTAYWLTNSDTQRYDLKNGHVYFATDIPLNEDILVSLGSKNNGSIALRNLNGLVKPGYDDIGYLQYYLLAGKTVNETIFPRFADMTAWFGVTETSQVTDAMKAEVKSYYAAHPTFVGSEIISADCEGAVSTGFNLCDNQFEGGCFNLSTGVKTSANNEFRTKNFINITPNKELCLFSTTDGNNFSGEILFYDADGNYLNYIAITAYTSGSVYLFNTPNNAYKMYLAIYRSNSGWGTNPPSFDVNVNYSSDFNGTYKPYVGTLGTLSIPQGLRTAYPLRSAGSAYDEYDFERMKFVQRVGIVDLGTLNWMMNTTDYAGVSYFYAVVSGLKSTSFNTNIICNKYLTTSRTPQSAANKTIGVYNIHSYDEINVIDSDYTDAAAFKAAMSGVYLIYEKAEETDADVTSYFPEGFSPLLNAEAGGSITFKQTSTEFPLPNSTDYFVKTSPSTTT